MGIQVTKTTKKVAERAAVNIEKGSCNLLKLNGSAGFRGA